MKMKDREGLIMWKSIGGGGGNNSFSYRRGFRVYKMKLCRRGGGEKTGVHLHNENERWLASKGLIMKRRVKGGGEWVSDKFHTSGIPVQWGVQKYLFPPYCLFLALNSKDAIFGRITGSSKKII